MIYGLKGVWETMVGYVQAYNCVFECDLWREWPLIRKGHTVISLNCFEYKYKNSLIGTKKNVYTFFIKCKYAYILLL